MSVPDRLTYASHVKTSFAFSLMLAAASCTSIMQAATLYWDGDANGANNNLIAGTGLGGAGSWNTSLSGTPLVNWWPGAGTTDQSWVNAGNDTAVFSGTGGTVSLTDSITAGGLTFNSTGYTLNTGANTLTLATGSTISLNNSAAATITGAVTGPGAVTITRGTTGATGGGAIGTLNLNGTSTGGWSGATTISNGATLSLSGSNQALLNTSSIALGGGITLTNASLAEAGLNRISDTAAITSTGGTFTVTNTVAAATPYSETIGAVTLSSGLLNIVTTNANAGGTQVLTLANLTQSGSGTVAFGAGGGLNASTNQVVVTGKAQTTAGQIIGPWATVGTSAASQTDYAVYDGTSHVVAANIAASAESTWTTVTDAYTVDSSGGTTTLGDNRTITALRATGTAQTLALNGFNLETNGILNGGSGTLTISGSGVVRRQGISAGNLYVNAGSADITISSIIANNTGKLTLVKTGGGKLTLNGANTFTGDTVVQEGSLQLSSTTRTGGNLIVGSVGGGAAAIFNPGNLITIFDKTGGVYTGNSNITVYSNGTANLLGSSDGYINDITVIGGTVTTLGSVYFHGSVYMAGGTITGTLYGNNNGGFSITTTASASTATFGSFDVYQTKASTFSVADGSAAIDLNVAGRVNTSGASQGITKSGAGLMQLSYANNYTGATTVNGGTVRAGVASVANVSGAFGKNSAVTLANTAGVTLDITGFNTQIGSLAGGGATGGIVTLGAATLTTGGNNTNTSFAGVISGTGGLTKIGTGAQTFTRANTYTGSTTVSAGVLNLGIANAISSSSNAVLSGGTLQSAFSQTLGMLNLSASSTLDLSTGGVFAFADSSSLAGSWTGTLSIIGTFTDGVSVRFGTSDLALTAGQLSQITINGVAAGINASGYLTSSVPEPSSYAAIFGVLALAGAALRRRRTVRR